jgi:2-oxo-3-hexenedioate decarboxylase
MAGLTPRLAAIADRLDTAFAGATQLASISAGDPAFDVAQGYEVLAELHARRVARGLRPVGRKIGFTNTTIWARYGVDRPMWSHVWDTTLAHARDGRAEVALDGLMQPRIEPEVVFGLAAPLPPGDDPVALLRAVAWIAAGFEIVHSVFPGWKFTAADCTAALGLHGRLVVGAPLAVSDANRAMLAAAVPAFEVELMRGDTVVERGSGANVLGSPLRALAHLRDVLSTQPWAPPLGAGEIVTTGTLTDAHAVRPGEMWRASYGTLGVEGFTLTMR